MVDAADQDKMEASKNEFHNLLDKPQLNGIPVLVLANKRDLPGALDEREVIDRMYVTFMKTTVQSSSIYQYSVSKICSYTCTVNLPQSRPKPHCGSS